MLSEKEKEYSRRWRANHREQHRQIQKRRMLEINRLAFDNLGGACAWCGLDYRPVLEIDHINNDRSKEKHRKSHKYRAAKVTPKGYNYYVVIAIMTKPKVQLFQSG